MNQNIDIHKELEHKSSILPPVGEGDNSVTTDQELQDFEKTGVMLIASEYSTVPTGITSGINETYIDGIILRLPQSYINDLPNGVKGSVMFVTNERGKLVGNNPYRELMTDFTKKTDKYSVLNRQSDPFLTDMDDCVVDFEIVPIVVGIQVGGLNPNKIDFADGTGFVRMYKSGEVGNDDEVSLVLKTDTIQEKVNWHMPAKGPKNSTQVLGLDRVEGNEAFLKWVDVPEPIDPNPADNCVPNWIELDVQTNTCVTKSSYGVSEITVEKRKLKLLVCGEVGPARCVTNPSTENCCPQPSDDPDYECLSFGVCSNKSYPNVLCATIETIAGSQQIEITYDPIAIPGTNGIMCDYRGTYAGKTIYLYLGGQHTQDISNTTPLGSLLYVDDKEFRGLTSDDIERIGCSPLYLKFTTRDPDNLIKVVAVNECPDILIDCPDLPDDPIDPPDDPICDGCTVLSDEFTFATQGVIGEFAPKLNTTCKLLKSDPCNYSEEQTQYYYPNVLSFVTVVNNDFSQFFPVGTTVVILQITSIESFQSGINKYRTAEYVAVRNPNETCCKDYTLSFLRIAEADYSNPSAPVLNSYFNRGSLPAEITVYAKPCTGGGGNGPCSTRDCSNCPQTGKTPKRFNVLIAGLSACSALNGSYYYDQSEENPCKFVRTGAASGSQYDELILGTTASLSISDNTGNYAIFSGSYTTCSGLNLTFASGGGSCITDTSGTATLTSLCGSGGGGGGGGGGSVTVPCCPGALPSTFVATFTGTYASFGTATLTWNGIRWEFNGTLSSGTCGTITQLILTCNNPGPPDWLLGITGTDIDTVTPIGGALGSSTYDCAVPQIDFSAVSTSGACAGAFGVILSE